MSGLTLTISRDKDVLVVIGAGGEILVDAPDDDRRALFAKLQYALMQVADLDGAWRQQAPPSLLESEASPASAEPEPPVTDSGETVISLAARRAAKDAKSAR